jgi:hypothetical protein
MSTTPTALIRKQWPLGWNPSADPVNGDPTGLLRMDNLRQDEIGVLSLVRGIQQVNVDDFPDFVSKIYSKNIAGIDMIWVAIGENGSYVVRSANGTFTDSLILGAGNAPACFGDCLGEVLCLAGQLRIKDNGTTATPLGLKVPLTPIVQSVSQPILNIIGTGWTVLVGTQNATGPGSIYALVDPTTLTGIVELAASYNTLSIDGGLASNADNDLFQFNFIPDQSDAVTSITVTIAADSVNYFQYTWNQGDLLPGPQQTSVLSATRSSFTRYGLNSTEDWSKITTITFAVTMTALYNYSVAEIGFYGGVQGQLNGVYTWVQVNVTNNGYYLAKSPPSLPTLAYTVINGYVTLVPQEVDAVVTDIWFFRTTALGSQAGDQTSFLDQYYQTCVTKPGVPVQDTTSDDDAIQIDIILNPYLLSLLPTTDDVSVTEAILSVEGLYNERMLYLSQTSLYLSDQLNPDAVDSRYTIKVSGDPTEYNIWVRKLTNNVLILATSKNLYEISGTLLVLPDGSIDANVISIGENYPPFGQSGSDAISAGGSIFYVASDGIRATSGSNSQLISPQLNLLFQGETRQGIPPVTISPYGYYPISLGRGRLLCCLPLTDGSRWLFIYDLISQTWRIQYTDPVSIFTTLTDRVLLGYNESTSQYTVGNLFELDKGPSGFNDTNGDTFEGFKVNFQTVWDDNQQPNNRKDTFTLKLVVDTGGYNHSVYISPLFASDIDGDNTPDFIYLGNINTLGPETVYFNLSNPLITLAFKYAIKIVDVSLTVKFELYELTLDYLPRPEQVNYFRIQPDNLGTVSRKRFINYAFVIDTLGNNITFTPLVDNNNTNLLPQSITFSTQVKETVIFYFDEEVIGTDISGILSGGVFEFYGLATGEIVSEKLPVPAEYLVIPANNFGEPNRKRYSSYKFQINTRGSNVTFTPRIDGTNYSPLTFSTTEKRTVEYFFDDDTIGIDIGGILQSVSDPLIPFEFYGVIVPQTIEVLPARLQFYRIPNTDFGVPSKKRVRTIPMVLNTNGLDVEFTPLVDSSPVNETSIFNTNDKTTVYHYFKEDTDSFGTDFGGELTLLNPTPSEAFEYYSMGSPLIVEELPLPRMYDQLGPIRFDKIGKMFGFRVRLLVPGNGYNDVNLPYVIYGDSSGTLPFYGTTQFNGIIVTNPGIDDVYEVQFPKNVNLTIFRLTLGPSSNPFYRYDVQVRVAESGMETDAKWVPIR